MTDKIDVKSVYGSFLTNKAEEEKGKWHEFGAVRIRIARAGGGNKRFSKLLEAKTRPYQRAIKTETMDNAVAERIMREVFAETIVTGWQTKVNDKWEDVVLFLDGTTAPTTPQAVVRAFEDIPELFIEVQDIAGKVSAFRDAQIEGNSGN